MRGRCGQRRSLRSLADDTSSLNIPNIEQGPHSKYFFSRCWYARSASVGMPGDGICGICDQTASGPTRSGVEAMVCPPPVRSATRVEAEPANEPPKAVASRGWLWYRVLVDSADLRPVARKTVVSASSGRPRTSTHANGFLRISSCVDHTRTAFGEIDRPNCAEDTFRRRTAFSLP